MSTSKFEIDEILRSPRETLEIKIKQWFNIASNENKAMLAKGIIALANHGGGAIIIGPIESSSGQFVVDPNRPPNLNCFSPDNVQAIVSRYLAPPVQCRVENPRPPGS